MELKRYKDKQTALRDMTGRLMQLMDGKEKSLPFYLALSGGETAKSMFALWADEYRDRIDWDRLRFFWVDERCVPPTSPDSNYGHADRLLFQPLGIPEDHICRIKGEEEPETEAVRYAKVTMSRLPLVNRMPAFDCMILGVGGDLHTASIFPNRQELLSDERCYAVARHPDSGQYRITMTGPLLLNKAPLLVPILGSGKEAVIQRLAAGHSSTTPTPASYILTKAAEATVYTEGKLSGE